MKSRWLETSLKIMIMATFLVPLVVIPSGYIFPFIVPKIVWFRSLTVILTGLYILLLATNWEKYRPDASILNIAVGLFFVSFCISTFVGVDWYKSFWDNHERMLGLFTVFHFVLYYFVITSVTKEWCDWKWYLRLFLIAGSVVMLLGLFQKINPNFLLNRGADRVSATLGNAIYFSGYGLFLFYMGLLLFFKEKIPAWKYGVLGMGILGFWGIFGGGTRGTFLGLVVGFIVAMIIYAITFKEYRKVRIAMVSGFVGLVALTGLLIAFRKTGFVQHIPAVGRFFTDTYNPNTPRFMAWGIAIESWKEKPVFGWGPNNYYFSFNKYYRPQFLEAGWGETWFDNAHNIILNTLAVQGLIGIVLYIGLFGSGFFVLVRAFRHKKLDTHFFAFSTAFLVGHFVHNITVFENPTSYLYFFFFLAFINQVSKIDTGAEAFQVVKSNIRKESQHISFGLTIVVSLAVILTIYTTNINPARANKAALQSLKYIQTDVNRSFALYKQALSIPSPHADDIVSDFTRVFMENFDTMQATPSQFKDMLGQMVHNLENNKKIHPLDIRAHIQLSQMYSLASQVYGDTVYLEKSEKELTDALGISPKRQQLQYSLAAVKAQLGKYDEAADILKESINNDMTIGEGWWRLALTYENMGNIDQARSTMLEARQKGVKFDSKGKEVEKKFLGEIVD